jgi:hypothetical protein
MIGKIRIRKAEKSPNDKFAIFVCFNHLGILQVIEKIHTREAKRNAKSTYLRFFTCFNHLGIIQGKIFAKIVTKTNFTVKNEKYRNFLCSHFNLHGSVSTYPENFFATHYIPITIVFSTKNAG